MLEVLSFLSNMFNVGSLSMAEKLSTLFVYLLSVFILCKGMKNAKAFDEEYDNWLEYTFVPYVGTFIVPIVDKFYGISANK